MNKDNPQLVDLMIHHEGLRYKPYLCTRGKITIGVGRNLSTNGLTRDEVFYLLNNDLDRCIKEAEMFKWYLDLSDPRKIVIISMLFNMGLERFLTFKKMIAAMEISDYDKAANEMLASEWSGQVGRRAVELALIMKTGVL